MTKNPDIVRLFPVYTHKSQRTFSWTRRVLFPPQTAETALFPVNKAVNLNRQSELKIYRSVKSDLFSARTAVNKRLHRP